MGYRDLIDQTITSIMANFDDSVSIKIIEDQNGQDIGFDIIDSFDKKGVIYTFVYTMPRANKEPLDVEFKLEFKVWGEVVLIGWNRDSHNQSTRLVEKFKALYAVAKKELDQKIKAESKEDKAFQKAFNKLVSSIDFTAKIERDFEDNQFKILGFLHDRNVIVDYSGGFNEGVAMLSVTHKEVYQQLIEYLESCDRFLNQIIRESDERIALKDKLKPVFPVNPKINI